MSKLEKIAIALTVIGFVLTVYGFNCSQIWLAPKWYSFGLGVSPAIDITLAAGSTNPALSKYVFYGFGTLWLSSILFTVYFTDEYLKHFKRCKK